MKKERCRRKKLLSTRWKTQTNEQSKLRNNLFPFDVIICYGGCVNFVLFLWNSYRVNVALKADKFLHHSISISLSSYSFSLTHSLSLYVYNSGVVRRAMSWGGNVFNRFWLLFIVYARLLAYFTAENRTTLRFPANYSCSICFCFHAHACACMCTCG